jgi:hypothetical protein
MYSIQPTRGVGRSTSRHDAGCDDQCRHRERCGEQQHSNSDDLHARNLAVVAVNNLNAVSTSDAQRNHESEA